MVRPRHLKLLAVLKGKCSVNLPALLNSLLHDAARSLKKAQHTDTIVSHHGLIRLIISHSLAQQQDTWEELVETVKMGLALPRTSSTLERSEEHKEPAAEKHAVSKRKRPSDTPERPEEPREPVGTPNLPEIPRKSARLVRIRGRLAKIQKTAAQPIEIEDEPSEEEGELPEGNAEQSEAGTNQPEGGIEEENAQSMGSPLQDHPGEEELAAVLANMGEYGQASSPGGIPDGPAEEELPEEGHAEEAGEENLPGKEAEDINSGQSVPRAPEDVPGEEEEVKLKAKPSAEAREIEKLKKKHQRMLGMITRLRQQIRMLKASLRIQKTARQKKRTTAARTPRVRVRFEGRNPIRRPTVEEQSAVPNVNE